MQFHLARCNGAGARTIAWHHGLCAALARMMTSLGFKVRREPKSYQPGDDRFAEVAEAGVTGRRPDLHVTNRDTGESVLVDVTVSANTNKGTVRSGFCRPQAALTSAAKAKHRLYESTPNTTELSGKSSSYLR